MSKALSWDGVRLLPHDELLRQLEEAEATSGEPLRHGGDQESPGRVHRGVVELLRSCSPDSGGGESARSDSVKAWLQWCRAQKDRVTVHETDVPDCVLPAGVKASISDIKVGGGKKRFGPDDAIYNKYPDLRERVARGNSVLCVNNSVYDNVIFALRKFTGGMGDEDEDQPESAKTWMDYFLRPVNTAVRVVCTRKANGEAAHFSARFVKDRFVLCAGSKNVHLLLRNYPDLEKYRDSRYLVARTVAESALDMLSALDTDKVSLLLSFLHYTRVTAVFEVLQPHYQHVVDLSYLESSQLNLLTWTLPFETFNAKGKASEAASLCAMSPDAAIDLGRWFGLFSVPYDVIDADEADARMDLVRRGYDYEGEVLYFVDAKDNVIGLLKKKTAWYVLSRAIREKAASAMAEFKKNPGDYNGPSRQKKLTHRLGEIQTWLGFPDAFLHTWTKLGCGFLTWLVAQAKSKALPAEGVRGNFPVLWKTYLQSEKLTDQIQWT